MPISFNVATDKLGLPACSSTIGYTGTNPVADGYLTGSDSSGDTQVFVRCAHRRRTRGRP